jgi:type II secretory pathway pseudopilin PulG
MKSLAYSAVIAAALAVPTLSFAQQSNAPLTRAEVRAQLVQLQQAGYDATNYGNYPQDIQAAERRVAAQQTVAQNSAPVAATSYGPSSAGSSQSGSRASTGTNANQAVFFGN